MKATEVEVIAEGTRLDGKDVEVGKVVEIDESLAQIWLNNGIARIPITGKDPNNTEVYPIYLPVGKWKLSDGTIFSGTKVEALDAEERLKQGQTGQEGKND